MQPASAVLRSPAFTECRARNIAIFLTRRRVGGGRGSMRSRKGKRLGMGVDLPPGSGWRSGGPER